MSTDLTASEYSATVACKRAMCNRLRILVCTLGIYTAGNVNNISCFGNAMAKSES